MKTTLNAIRDKEPCRSGWGILLKSLNKTGADDEPLSLLHILESNGVEDAIWCLRAVEGCEKEKRLFAVFCARQVQNLMKDPRSLNALDVAERFANGEATESELKAAYDAADADAHAASADAASADAHAASAAAHAASADVASAYTSAHAASADAHAASAAAHAASADVASAYTSAYAASAAAYAASAAAHAASADVASAYTSAAAYAAARKAQKDLQALELKRVCENLEKEPA
jgi:hypothetical protein